MRWTTVQRLLQGGGREGGGETREARACETGSRALARHAAGRAAAQSRAHDTLEKSTYAGVERGVWGGPQAAVARAATLDVSAGSRPTWQRTPRAGVAAARCSKHPPPQAPPARPLQGIQCVRRRRATAATSQGAAARGRPFRRHAAARAAATTWRGHSPASPKSRVASVKATPRHWNRARAMGAALSVVRTRAAGGAAKAKGGELRGRGCGAALNEQGTSWRLADAAP